jgi:hypothetical protein
LVAGFALTMTMLRVLASAYRTAPVGAVDILVTSALALLATAFTLMA